MVKSSFSLELVVTMFCEIAMALLNLFVAFIVLTIFGNGGFSNYLSITSLVSILAIPSIGIQNAMAVTSSRALNSNTLTQSSTRSITIKRYAIGVATIWITSAPIISIVLEIPLRELLSATLFVLAPISIAAGSGFLQGVSSIVEWRLLLLFSTFLQIPLIILVWLTTAELAFLVLLMAIPGQIFLLLVTRRHRHLRSYIKTIRIKFSGFLGPVQFAISSSLLILANKILFVVNDAKLISTVYIFGFLTNTASVVGSITFSRLLRLRSERLALLAIGALGALPSLGCGALIAFIQSLGLQVPILNKVVGSTSSIFLTALVSTSICWSISSSLYYAKFNTFASRFAAFGSGLLVLELTLILSLEIRGLEAVSLHALFGFLQLLLIIRDLYFSTQSLNRLRS